MKVNVRLEKALKWCQNRAVERLEGILRQLNSEVVRMQGVRR